MKLKFILWLLLGQMAAAHSLLAAGSPAAALSNSGKAGYSAANAGFKGPGLTHASATARGARAGFAPKAALPWSDNATWTSFGATKPVAGSTVTIPAGVHILLDESTPSLAGLNIDGKLEFANQDLTLTAGWIMVMGALEVGTATTPFTRKATITLTATNQNESIMGMGTRGIMVMGGKLDLHGAPPIKHYTKLNEHAVRGATGLSLAEPVLWNVGDQIVVATTDYYSDVQHNAPSIKGSAQRTQITALSGNSLTMQDGLNAHRWGKLQYLTATGMSLTPGALPAGILPGTPTVLDERAEVANLTRNIVVQAVDDDGWRNNGFGCHIMIMRMNDLTGEARLDGVEIRRGGQAGRLARYPFHWHMLSYQGSATLPDITGQYIRNSTINQSSQRGIVIHGTNGSEVKNNIVYDVLGHGIFTEDASERRNIIDGNLVFKVRNPSEANVLKFHETWRSRGSSGFWISNPDNTIINNTAADCHGNGFWLAFPKRTFGASAGITMRPNRMKFGTFKNNHAHSNNQEGINLDIVEIDEAGNTGDERYGSTTDGQEEQWPWNTVLTFELADYTTWKNNRNGIWNRSTAPLNLRVVSADNSERFFAGSIDNKESAVPAVIEKSLVVGTSLNYNMNGVENPTYTFGSGPRSAFASYHSSVDIVNNVVVNFPAEPGKASGYMALNDYYISPVDKGNTRNIGNILINTHPGVRTKPSLNQHVFGVLWDNHNYMGVEASQDNYYVFDEPFFTHGQTRHIVAPDPGVSGGVVIRGPFYGFLDYHVNGIKRTYEKIAVTRTTAAGAIVGNWVVEAGAFGDVLGNMRHFASHPSGYYYLDFPTIDNVNDFIMRVDNMLTTNDYQVLSVEYSGNYTISQLFASRSYDMHEYGGAKPFPTGQNHVSAYTAVADFQSVVNAPAGQVYWQDKTNNKVWFKVRGGFYAGDPTLPATHDINLYKAFRIRAYGVYAPATYTVTFNVRDAAGAAVSGAAVVFNGRTVTSDASGAAAFTGIAAGSGLPYSASKAGFNNASGTVNVAANTTATITLTAPAPATYTVTFTVRDAAGAAVSGASVSFGGRTVVSDAAGAAAFTNVAAGSGLAYSASKTGFNNSSGTVNVAANTTATITLTAPAPATYTVTFNVRDAAGAAVSGAAVVFNGRTVTSDASGAAAFTGIAAGSGLPYSASKTGFNNASGTVNVAANTTQAITLTTTASPTYTVTFNVRDAAGAAVSGASVSFGGRTVVSDAAGAAAFTNVAAGSGLAYSASKAGFNNASGTVNVAANTTQAITLTTTASPTYTVTFTVKDAAHVLLSGASVTFNGQTLTTTAGGEAVFANVAQAAGLPYSVSRSGFTSVSGTLTVAASNMTHFVVLTASPGPGPGPDPTPEPHPEPHHATLNPRNIFSPNGDGANEVWEVVGIEQEPELQVTIFNMYGQQVYKARPYTNSWSGDNLPEGVYYYHMQDAHGKSVKKGSITLVR